MTYFRQTYIFFGADKDKAWYTTQRRVTIMIYLALMEKPLRRFGPVEASLGSVKVSPSFAV